MDNLRKKLTNLDGKGYKALKGIQGTYEGPFYTMTVDYVQGDPFASPSKLRLFVPIKQTDFNLDMFKEYHRRVAFEHFFGKSFASVIQHQKNTIRGTGKKWSNHDRFTWTGHVRTNFSKHQY
ncbi:MAG: ABC-ATPase domain-containing protein [Bacillus sp. (in: Bacteria)]|nr:ABC-ATPase domain-containing protein [Bacillus sp. (in: firmicutes)]